jgi:polyribonucleotide nucleotidyltransferase
VHGTPAWHWRTEKRNHPGKDEREGKEVKVHRIETEFAGRKLVIETGRLAKQAAGSAWVQYGDTVVLAAVTVSPNVSTLPFFPLTVEYKEKSYAAGKFPGGFIKREGRPSDKEILSSRLIDRGIRPLFPEGFKNEVQVFVTVMSADQENDPDVLAAIAASTAMAISPLPWNGPLAAVRVGRIEGKWVLNPTFQQLEFSEIDLVVSGSEHAIFMVEGGALEVGEQDVLDALKVAQKGLREIIAIQKKVIADAKKPTMEWTKPVPDAAVVARVRELAEKEFAKAINAKDKASRAQNVKGVKQKTLAAILAEFPDKVKDAGHELEGEGGGGQQGEDHRHLARRSSSRT